MKAFTTITLFSSVSALTDAEIARLQESLNLIHTEDLNIGEGFGQNYYYGDVDYISFESLVYQENLNYDYMSYDRYDLFRPFGNQYTTYNTARKIMNINDVMDCGDCLRGGYLFCTKGSVFGSSYSTMDQKPL